MDHKGIECELCSERITSSLGKTYATSTTEARLVNVCALTQEKKHSYSLTEIKFIIYLHTDKIFKGCLHLN